MSDRSMTELMEENEFLKETIQGIQKCLAEIVFSARVHDTKSIINQIRSIIDVTFNRTSLQELERKHVHDGLLELIKSNTEYKSIIGEVHD